MSTNKHDSSNARMFVSIIFIYIMCTLSDGQMDDGIHYEEKNVYIYINEQGNY